MGQKVHPYGFRLGVTKTWRSRWFAKGLDYARLLEEDLDLKRALHGRLKSAGVSSIEVDRPGNKLRITIRTSRPGIIIGRKGAEIEKLKSDLNKKTGREVFIDIQEVHKPELDAQLVAESIALQLEKRVAFRRAMRKSVDSAQRFGCKGIKVRVSGRLNGAEIARSEWYLHGQLPLHTLRADIDYGFAQAYTTYGVIGIKTWVYKGEVIPDGPRRTGDPEPRRQPRREPRGDGRDRGGDNRGGDRGGDRGADRGGDRRGPRPTEHAPVAASDQPKVTAAPVVLPIVAPVITVMPPVAQPQPTWTPEAPKPTEALGAGPETKAEVKPEVKETKPEVKTEAKAEVKPEVMNDGGETPQN